MYHHLWYDTFDNEMNAARGRRPARPTTRRPVARRGGTRRAIGRALMGLGERLAS